MDQETLEPFWAIIEVFGHQRFAGLVGEQVIAGYKMFRIDIPAVPEERREREGNYHPLTGDFGRWKYTEVFGAVEAEAKLFGVKAVYSITPCTEEHARAEAANMVTSRSCWYTDISQLPEITEEPDEPVLIEPIHTEEAPL